VTELVAAMRKVARRVPGAAGAIARVARLDYSKPGKPDIDSDDAAAKQLLVSDLVTDALVVLGELSGPDAPQRDDKAADALGLLALVAGQDVESAEGADGTDGRWRIARRVAPDRVISTVDPEARHTRKSKSTRRDGFRGHVSAEPETGLITDAELTTATGEKDAGLRVYGDSAYGTGAARAAYRDAGHQMVIKPNPLRPAVPGGFTLDDFTVDEPAGAVTCPAGHTRPMSHKRTVTFGRLCAHCPLRAAVHHRRRRPVDEHPPARAAAVRRPRPGPHPGIHA